MEIFTANKYDCDAQGYFDSFGGRYVPELLISALDELTNAYQLAKHDKTLQDELAKLYQQYGGRPTPLYFAERLTKETGGAKIYLKNEGLNHTGSHKINHCLGQALLAKRMGKTRLIAETGAGQHGIATATVAAKFGFSCTVYMGAVDVERQRPNVFWMEQLGAKVIPVDYGTKRLKDAVMAALQDWLTNPRESYYMLGSVVGPHPYPSMVRDFQSIIGLETRQQILELEGRLPDYLVACVGGGSNAMGLFNAFLGDDSVQMIGVEAGGKGNAIAGGHSVRLANQSRVAVVEGYKSYFIVSEDGQVGSTHSIAAGLDYPGVGPQHALLYSKGRVQYQEISDQEALEAFQILAVTEGIICALESAHAVAFAMKLGAGLSFQDIVIVNLSGRGDKDIFTLADNLADKSWKEYLRRVSS